MHQEFSISDRQTLYYRYNPQGDVLAVRFKPDFKAAEERPLPAQPAVTISHDPEGGAALGLRISGVQQMLLQSLIREVFALAAPALGTAAPSPASSPSVQPVAAALAQPATPATPAPPAAIPAALLAPAQPPSWTKDRPAPPPIAAAEAPVPLANAAASDPSTEDAFEDDGGALYDDPAAEPRRRRRRRRRPTLPAEQDFLVSLRAVAPALPEATPGDGGASATPALEAPSHATNGRAQGSDLVQPPALPQPIQERDPLSTTTGAAAAVTTDDEGVETAGPWSGGDAVGDADAEQRSDGERRRRRRRRGRRGAEGAMDAGGESVAEEVEDDLPGDPESEALWDDEGRPNPEGFAPLGLHPRVAHAIADLGFNNPTPIQVEAIPVALTGEDLVGLAQTGTGKTLAFVAPSLSRLLGGPRPGPRPRMVILAPTRELAVQVALEAERLAAHTDLRVATIYGGVSMGQQTEDLRRGVDVVVATPGRILDHLRRRNVYLDAVEVLVLDEADRMLDMGFLPDVRAIIRQLPTQRQTMLFTATFPPEIESLSLEFQNKPRTVEIARRRPPESIDQRLYPVGRHLKAPLLVHLLETDATMDRALIFTERKVDADVLARKLRQDGVSVALMHGDRTQAEREQALAALKSRKVRVLVATNVAARGLDIEDISHVINYDIPQSVDEYVHRIGRTARAENLGKAYSFVTLSDEPMISRIEAALDRQLPRVQADGFDYDVPPPSWAKPSASDVLAFLNKETSVVDRLRTLSRRRR